MKTYRVALAVFIMMVAASTSFAGLLLDLRPVPAAGYTVDGKDVTFDKLGPATVHYQLVAVVTGIDADLTNEAFQTAMGGFKNTPGVDVVNTNAFTTFLPAENYVSPFTTTPTPAPAVTPNLIGLEGATTGAQLAMRASGKIATTAVSNSFLLAEFTSSVNVTALDNKTFAQVSYVKAGASTTTYSWTMDGSGKTGNSTSQPLITVGAPVNLIAEVPEPTTLGLLLTGVAGIGLCLWRRKRA